jgi:uncharacterized protein
LALMVAAIVTAAAGQPPAPSLTSTKVTADGLVAELYAPAEVQGRLPAVIVLGGSEGGMNHNVTQEARLLARHGFAALQLAYFGMPGVPATLQLIRLEYFKTAIDWLCAQPDVDPIHIGIEGTSIGGEAALTVAAHYPEIKAVVAAVPSSVVWPGIGGVERRPPSTFTLAGKPLPDLPFGWVGALHDTYALYKGGLPARVTHPGAIIPVEAINGPVMLICGKRDADWPSCPMSDQIAARLRAKRFTHPIQLLEYADAGHAVFGPPLTPTSGDFPSLGLLGGTPAANDAARSDDWAKSLAFMDAALKPSSGLRDGARPTDASDEPKPLTDRRLQF